MIVRGVHGLVVCGATGEAASLDADEQMAVLAAVLDTARDRCPVMMGVGGSDTRSVALKIRQFNATATIGYLVSAPSYVRPSQEGILRHFEAVAAETTKPIVLYNIPGRTGVNMEPATVAALSARPQFCAIKEAGGHLQQLTDLIGQSRLSVLCGDDAMLFAALCAGAHGAFSAAAHIRPDLYVQLFDLIGSQQLNRARALFRHLLPMIKLLFSEPNPAPLKAALSLQGRLREELRLPMTPVSHACKKKLAVALKLIMALPLYSRAPNSPSPQPLLAEHI